MINDVIQEFFWILGRSKKSICPVSGTSLLAVKRKKRKKKEKSFLGIPLGFYKKFRKLLSHYLTNTSTPFLFTTNTLHYFMQFLFVDYSQILYQYFCELGLWVITNTVLLYPPVFLYLPHICSLIVTFQVFWRRDLFVEPSLNSNKTLKYWSRTIITKNYSNKISNNIFCFSYFANFKLQVTEISIQN